ncbi:MAG: hypothetical protein KAR21_17810, partial [Spirochaetales bacterium]|nr:hypothetical protein [Spirochaetales bacterium]
MKKLSTLIILLFFIFGILYGMDFGGNIKDTSILSYSEELGDYRESNLSLWLTADFGNDLSFFSQGSYTYSTVTPYLFELDFLNIRKETSSLLSYTAGRLWTADFSGYIFNHTMDGVSAELNFPTAILSISAGYTGLLFKDSSSVLITRADQSDQFNSEIIFAAPRAVGGLDLLLPELFMAQDLNISFWMQMDLRSGEEILDEDDLFSSTKGGKLHTQYS